MRLATFPALLARRFPMVVVGAVDTSGFYAPYSQGLASELTVSAPGRVFCASPDGGVYQRQGTSHGEPLSVQISLISDDIGHGDLAAPAVAGLAAYFMSLDQYRARLLVPGSVARNVRDLIRSLAYPRHFLQPAVVWNGVDSGQFYCPVRRDASVCPAQNATLPIAPPAIPSPGVATGTSTTSVTSSSNPPTSSIATAISTAMVTSSSNSLSSITATDLSTASIANGGQVVTVTLTPSAGGGAMETETITETLWHTI